MTTTARILFVDDEPNVLIGVTRALRGHYELLLATSGADALQQLSSGPIDVVVSDMRMPQMDGATFLSKARAISPDTVRLVMSGHSDLEASVRAINEGHIFRFLIKPVKREVLVEVLDAAVEQHRLVLAERELLERTLTGAVDALSEGLAMTSPLAFGRSRRLKHIASALADELKLPGRWAIEVAAMLSQLGAAALPPETLRRWYAEEPLSAAEREMVARVTAQASQQLSHIPRLEKVLELIVALGEDTPSATIPARLLQVANALERRLARGEDLQEALAALSASPLGDSVVLAACRRLKGLLLGQGPQSGVAVADIQAGMVLAEDVFSKAGALLISRGHLVSEGLITCLRNFAATVGVREPLQVSVPESTPSPPA
jgi:CheY-like chemotaxis protein